MNPSSDTSNEKLASAIEARAEAVRRNSPTGNNVPFTHTEVERILTALRSSPTVRNRDEVLEEAAKVAEAAEIRMVWGAGRPFFERGRQAAADAIRALKDTTGLGLT